MQIEIQKKDIKMFKLGSKQEKSEVSTWIEQYKAMAKLRDLAKSEGEVEANVLLSEERRPGPLALI